MWEWSSLTSRSLLEIGVVKDQERAVATKLECTLLEAIRANLRNELANARAAGEGDLLDKRMSA